MRTLLLTVIVLIVAGFSSGCQKRVVRDTSYAPEQFPQYSHLPRSRSTDRWEAEQKSNRDWFGDMGDGMENVGDGIGDATRSIGRGLGGMFSGWGGDDGDSDGDGDGDGDNGNDSE